MRPMATRGEITRLADLDLPRLDYLDPELRGDRFHEVMLGLADESWLATWDLGCFVLDREAAGFFLRTDKAAFPGVTLLELVGITDGPLWDSLSRNIISLNGDQHKRLRKLVHSSFTPKAADRYRPAMREILGRLWKGVSDRGECDFVADFAKPYPAEMIATVIGAPMQDAARLHHLSNLLQAQFDAIALATRRAELEEAAVEFDAYVEGLVTDRKGNPGDDLVSRLITAEEEGDRLSHDECVGLVRDALNGGIDTTQSQLAHGVRLFAGHPDQWEALGADPDLAPAAAEEILRFEPVAPFTTRILLEDVEYRGVAFPKDTVVTVSQFSANRDLEGDDPLEFDIRAERGGGKALTFGAGPHFCMGANLARAELQEGLAFLASHLKDLDLAGEPEYGTITGLYGMDSLPIRFASS